MLIPSVEIPANIALSGVSYSVFILLTVILLKALITHLVTHEPLTFFQFYCQKLANKVNKAKNSANQQTIAGLVALVLTLVPLVIMLYLFAAFIEVNWLWQGLLLYLALGSFSLDKKAKEIAQALAINQIYYAKQTLAPKVLRDTENLSSLGVTKATIEMLLLRILQQGYTVSALFLFFGPLTALSYRLILEMHYAWNIKINSNINFGLRATQLMMVLQWLPVRVFSLCILISTLGRDSLLFWRLSKKYFFTLNNDIAISLFALALEVKLGGVAMYQQNKLRKISFNHNAKQPLPIDILHAGKLIKQVLVVNLLFIVIIAITSFVVQTAHRS